MGQPKSHLFPSSSWSRVLSIRQLDKSGDTSFGFSQNGDSQSDGAILAFAAVRLRFEYAARAVSKQVPDSHKL